MLIEKISGELDNNLCKLQIPAKRVRNQKSLDIFLGEFDCIFFMDKFYLRFKSKRKFDLKDTKNTDILYDSKEKVYSCAFPCIPEDSKSSEAIVNISSIEKGSLERNEDNDLCKTQFEVLKLKRITENCNLRIDGGVPVQIDSHFSFGFGSSYDDESFAMQSALQRVQCLGTPLRKSPIQRTFLREADEVKNFCRDQYKLNFLELLVPEGHENPVKFTVNYGDCQQTSEEKQLINTLNSTKLDLVNEENQNEIDCGLINILLAICYDVRSTFNEPTCESPWTRTVLSSTLSYFEVFDNVKSVVECFLRRSLTYPLYRNYDYSRLCLDDAIVALRRGKNWIVKQLLVTYDMFLNGNESRELLNKFYIEDYIKYVSNYIDNDHLHMLSQNLKNVVFDVTKKSLRLGLTDIETELLKELIEDMHSSQSSGGEDSEFDEEYDETENDEEGDEDDEEEDEDDDSSSQEEDTNSVIENKT